MLTMGCSAITNKNGHAAEGVGGRIAPSFNGVAGAPAGEKKLALFEKKKSALTCLQDLLATRLCEIDQREGGRPLVA
jgi:hypothetical protein